MSPKVRQKRIEWMQKRCDEIAIEIADLEAEIGEFEDEKDKLNSMIDSLEDGEDVPVGEDEPEEFNTDPVPEMERDIIETLLAYAPLCGIERTDLEEMIEDDDFDRRRYQEVYNSHIHVIHQHQR